MTQNDYYQNYDVNTLLQLYFTLCIPPSSLYSFLVSSYSLHLSPLSPFLCLLPLSVPLLPSLILLSPSISSHSLPLFSHTPSLPPSALLLKVNKFTITLQQELVFKIASPIASESRRALCGLKTIPAMLNRRSQAAEAGRGVFNFTDNLQTAGKDFSGSI